MNYLELAKRLLDNTFQFRKLGHLKRINRSMKGEIFVMLYILKRGGGVLPSEISGEMNISSSRIAAVLNSLEGKGYITREIDASDRRRILVDLTPKGVELAIKHDKMVVQGTVKVLKLLSDDEALEFVRIIEKLAASVSEIT